MIINPQKTSLPAGYTFWDCWYLYDRRTSVFHLYILSARQKYKKQGTQDLYSRLAYATTKDFSSYEFLDLDVIAVPSGGSVWSGCVFRWTDSRYRMFYTERYSEEDYRAGQRIRMAESKDLKTWRADPDFSLGPESVDPGGKHFLRRSGPADQSVHAWRDPFVFLAEGQIYMLVSAKNVAPEKRRGCIALLKAENNSLTDWNLVNPALVSGFEELELPQIYVDRNSGEIVLVASGWAEEDYLKSEQLKSGSGMDIAAEKVRENPLMLQFRAPDWKTALQDGFIQKENLLGPESGVYGGFVVPELHGAMLGFDLAYGGPRLVLTESVQHLAFMGGSDGEKLKSA